MGDIPAKTAMVSSVITFPTTGGQAITAGTTFDIKVQTQNIVAGSFTNADSTYYAAPQALQGGKVVGHTHVTVQDLGNSLNPTKALDATQFAFFKGINDAGNGQGLLSATVTGGLPAGNYRVCTMTSASNHQPVLMPVAQRGTPDDCTKFVVGAAGGNNNANANAGNANANAGNANAGNANAGNANGGKAAASSAAAKGGNNAGNAAATSAAAKATAAAGANNGKANANAGNANAGNANANAGGNGKKFGQKRRARRDFIA